MKYTVPIVAADCWMPEKGKTSTKVKLLVLEDVRTVLCRQVPKEL